ncbi:uncharacterized protein [Prorops nasuta]|uniref:uncharacterized protein n=1 Tax=Prorops nasuta TaxID=863751 RepID=UPI0034CDC692
MSAAIRFRIPSFSLHIANRQSFEFANSLAGPTTQNLTHASWKDENAIRYLINTWKEHSNDFKSSKYKAAEVWKKIAVYLKTENNQWMYTGVQCENKFKELRKRYVKVKDHNRQSGNSPMTFKFYEEMEEILGNKPFVVPVSLTSNLRKRTQVTGQQQSSDTENEDNPDVYKPDTPKEKKRKTKVQKELGEWSVALREDARQRELAREQRHKELISTSKHAITVYQEMMKKLIEKI